MEGGQLCCDICVEAVCQDRTQQQRNLHGVHGLTREGASGPEVGAELGRQTRDSGSKSSTTCQA